MAFTLTREARTLALVSSLLVAPAVFAHAHLQQQFPAADAAVTEKVQALTLSFSEGVEPAFSGVTLSSGHQAVKTGAVKLNAQDNKQLVVALEQPLEPGDYQVKWHVVSVDGHKTKGQYRFSVK